MKNARREHDVYMYIYILLFHSTECIQLVQHRACERAYAISNLMHTGERAYTLRCAALTPVHVKQNNAYSYARQGGKPSAEGEPECDTGRCRCLMR